MNLNAALRNLVVLVGSGAALSCGSTSELKPTAGVTPGANRFTKVLVRDFSNSVQDIGVRSKVEIAQKSFPDQIASEIQKSGAFPQVARGGRAGRDTLVIDGAITKYEEGNAALRLLIGLGAGSSRFDATVNFMDGGSGRRLGSILVDKNSWFLGGTIAMSQDPDDFIPGASKKVASEAAKFSPAGRQ